MAVRLHGLQWREWHGSRPASTLMLLAAASSMLSSCTFSGVWRTPSVRQFAAPRLHRTSRAIHCRSTGSGSESRGGEYILCTGGAGYIGAHTVVKLLSSGFKVAIADNFMNSSPKIMERLEEITGQTIPLFEVDLCDEKALDTVFEKQSFDGVIHFAGLKAVGESVAKPLMYYENNLRCTMNLLRSMETHNCGAIVFSSSATVYKPSDVPLNEDSPRGCTNPYGWTKFMIEQMLQDASKANENLAVSILRYFNPVGAHPSGRIGESPTTFPNNLMPFIQQVAVGRRDCLSVFGDDYDTPDGSGVRDYIHVDDLADGHVCAMKKLLEKKGGCFTHNLGSGKGHSVLEMVRAFESASGRNIPFKIAPRRPGDLASVVADASRARAELEWEPQLTLLDMCASAWQWQSTNPYGYEGASPES